MKYTGRIYLVSLSLFVSIIETILGVELSAIELFFDVIITAIAWWIGGLFDKLKFLSDKDFLTGVYNRRYIDKVIDNLLRKAELKEKFITVFVIDINKFKNLNDTYGHETGDLALRKISNILVESTKKNDLVVRWGGDEFLIITSKMNKHTPKKFINLLNNRIEEDINKSIFDDKINLSLSIGYSVFPEDATTFNELLSLADKRMYKIK